MKRMAPKNARFDSADWAKEMAQVKVPQAKSSLNQRLDQAASQQSEETTADAPPPPQQQQQGE